MPAPCPRQRHAGPRRDVSMHYVIIFYGGFQRYTDVSGHVTLHFELQRRILEVRYCLSSPLLYTLARTQAFPSPPNALTPGYKAKLGHDLRYDWRSRGVADPFAHAHAQLIDGQGQKSGVVKQLRRFSTVKNLDPGRSSGHGAYRSAPPPPTPPLVA